MIDADWKVLMHALSIKVQAIHFSNETTQRERDAIADHMIGIADLIEAYPVPTFIRALSDAHSELLSDMNEAADAIAFLCEDQRQKELRLSEAEETNRKHAQMLMNLIGAKSEQDQALQVQNRALKDALQKMLDHEDKDRECHHSGDWTACMQEVRAVLTEKPSCECGEPCHCGEARNHYCNHKPAEKKSLEPDKKCVDFGHLGPGVSAQDAHGEWTLTKCSVCGRIV
jgi:hypothetical protein